MSTDISDLPGADLELRNPNEYEENEEPFNTRLTQNIEETSEKRNYDEQPMYNQNEETNITEPVLSFKKKINLGYQTQTLFETVKKELNLTNLLLLFIIFFSATSSSNEYVRKTLNIIPFISRSGYSHMSVILIKSFVLLLAFVLIRKFVLS
jgi:hypothetical protein